MRAIRAREIIVHPRRPPVDDGAVVFDAGRVVASGAAHDVLRDFSGPVEDLGPVTVTPGLINAHVHLELSHVAGGTARGQGFTAWLRSLIGNSLGKLSQLALDKAIAQMRACGTVAVIDVTSRNTALVAEALEAADIGGLLAVEFFGFADAGALRWPVDLDALSATAREHVAAAGHALYSTHPETLRAAKAWCVRHGRPFVMHLAEHPDETEQLLTGKGEFARLLRKAGVLPEDWAAPGCRPVAYADRLGLLDKQTMAVHCVQLDQGDIATLAARGCAVCLCPRSNEYIAVGRAPWRALDEAGVPLCLGTDGLSSNQDLSLWNEAAALLRAPGGPGFFQVLEWMTLNPARLLGAEHLYGTLEPGAVAGYSIVPDGAIRAA
jgi:cytosine/adenosine deaminase-related metal-dependent hydrolase